MPSFDVVSETDLQEVDNAVQSVTREITTRFDFKGGKSSLERKEKILTLMADDSTRHKAMIDMIKTHIVRRKLDPKCLDFGKEEAASGNMIRQLITIKQGIPQEASKVITKAVKDQKMKVQASIQGDAVRVTGKKRDDLQEAMAMIRTLELDLPIQFTNFRD
jgi:cyclic-di-GMP-binding protein